MAQCLHQTSNTKINNKRNIKKNVEAERERNKLFIIAVQYEVHHRFIVCDLPNLLTSLTRRTTAATAATLIKAVTTSRITASGESKQRSQSEERH